MKQKSGYRRGGTRLIQLHTRDSHSHTYTLAHSNSHQNKPVSPYTDTHTARPLASFCLTHTVRSSSRGLLLPVCCWQTGSHHAAPAPQPSGCQDDDTVPLHLSYTSFWHSPPPSHLLSLSHASLPHCICLSPLFPLFLPFPCSLHLCLAVPCINYQPSFLSLSVTLKTDGEILSLSLFKHSKDSSAHCTLPSALLAYSEQSLCCFKVLGKIEQNKPWMSVSLKQAHTPTGLCSCMTTRCERLTQAWTSKSNTALYICAETQTGSEWWSIWWGQT